MGPRQPRRKEILERGGPQKEGAYKSYLTNFSKNMTTFWAKIGPKYDYFWDQHLTKKPKSDQKADFLLPILTQTLYL